jgi:DNA polymerase III delta prime subunit
MFESLWVEKYRPESLTDIVLSDDNRTTISSFTTDDSIPNLLFTGKPGIGKTSLAKILVKDVLGCQYLYINASDENGIDTVRTKITNFSRTKSLDGNIKVIILDEVDGLTLDAQRALRNTMEEYSSFVRFILTANFEHRVIPALQSRCQSFDLTPTVDGFIDRCKHVLDSEKVKYDAESTVLHDSVRGFYPDLRKAINELQKGSSTGTLSVNNQFANQEFIAKLFQLVQQKQVLKVRKFVIEQEAAFNGDYPVLLRELFNVIDSLDLPDSQKRDCLLLVSEYMYRSAFVLDQEINFYSCLVGLSKVI